MNIMPDHQRDEILREILAKVSEMYATIYGVKDQGGLLRVIEKNTARIGELEIFKWKFVGAVAFLAIIWGAIGGKIATLFSDKH